MTKGKRKQQRELATCKACGKDFTRLRRFFTCFEEGSPHSTYAPNVCLRCRSKLDMLMRKQALVKAKAEWEKKIDANDRAFAKVSSGQLPAKDIRNAG